MAADGVTFDTAFRVERRQVKGYIAVESCYMRSTVGKAGQPPAVSCSEGLVTMKRHPDGSWRIVSDATIPSTEAAWNAVKRVDGLKHDE